MVGRRILVIARHYWPASSDDTLRIRGLVEKLREEGFNPVIATPRWGRSWPRGVRCEEVPIFFIDNPPTSAFRLRRYQHTLSSWVSTQRDHFDTIYFDDATTDLPAVVAGLGKAKSCRVMVRFNPLSLSPLDAKNTKALKNRAEVCRNTDCVLVPDAAAHQTLIGAGIHPEKIVRFNDRFGTTFQRTHESKFKARQALAACNYDLMAKSQDRIVICFDDLTRECGIDQLIESLWELVEQRRQLKLWILGDSIERGRIYDRLQFFGVHRMIAMPGIFTDPELLMQAADLVLVPTAGRGLGWVIPSCVRSGIPFLTCESNALSSSYGPDVAALSFSQNTDTSLRSWISNWLSDSREAQTAIENIRKRFDSESSLLPVRHLFSGECNSAIQRPQVLSQN